MSPGSRLIVRRERRHSGAQLSLSMSLDGHRCLPLGKFRCPGRVVLARSALEVCAMTVRVEVSSSGGVITVAVVGEIDFRNAAIVGEALRQVLSAGAGRVRIDLSQVPFMDSTGMTALVAAYLGGRRNGIPVIISAVHPSLREKLEITGILSLFEVINGAPGTVAPLTVPNAIRLDGHLPAAPGVVDGNACTTPGVTTNLFPSPPATPVPPVDLDE
jgi:anti-anti-sigma factor